MRDDIHVLIIQTRHKLVPIRHNLPVLAEFCVRLGVKIPMNLLQ